MCAVSLSFFEAVILDRLVRGGGSQALILADVQGVRASLSEHGAQRVGEDYELEPVAVTDGVFHPKLTVLAAGDECHLLVGSGNLTFGGWGGNCESLEQGTARHVGGPARHRVAVLAGLVEPDLLGAIAVGDLRQRGFPARPMWVAMS